MGIPETIRNVSESCVCYNKMHELFFKGLKLLGILQTSTHNQHNMIMHLKDKNIMQSITLYLQKSVINLYYLLQRKNLWGLSEQGGS
jgi:hypothetical protein